MITGIPTRYSLGVLSGVVEAMDLTRDAVEEAGRHLGRALLPLLVVGELDVVPGLAPAAVFRQLASPSTRSAYA
jgi:hypothetical protein